MKYFDLGHSSVRCVTEDLLRKETWRLTWDFIREKNLSSVLYVVKGLQTLDEKSYKRIN